MDDIQDIQIVITVSIARVHRIGSRAAIVQVIYQKGDIQYIDIAVAVGVAADSG
jgi:hypothetical protein